jgi:hypothetical protein
MYYLFYGMPSCTSVRCRDCLVKNCSSTEYLHSSSTEYLRSSSKLARPRRWLEDLTCHQCTLQRRVERRVEPRGRWGAAAGVVVGDSARDSARSTAEESRENSSPIAWTQGQSPNAARKRVRCSCTIAPLNNKTLHPRTH